MSDESEKTQPALDHNPQHLEPTHPAPVETTGLDPEATTDDPDDEKFADL